MVGFFRKVGASLKRTFRPTPEEAIARTNDLDKIERISELQEEKHRFRVEGKSMSIQESALQTAERGLKGKIKLIGTNFGTSIKSVLGVLSNIVVLDDSSEMKKARAALSRKLSTILGSLTRAEQEYTTLDIYTSHIKTVLSTQLKTLNDSKKIQANVINALKSSGITALSPSQRKNIIRFADTVEGLILKEQDLVRRLQMGVDAIKQQNSRVKSLIGDSIEDINDEEFSSAVVKLHTALNEDKNKIRSADILCGLVLEVEKFQKESEEIMRTMRLYQSGITNP